MYTEYEEEKVRSQLTKDLKKCKNNMEIVDVIHRYEERHGGETDMSIKDFSIRHVNKGPLCTLSIYMGKDFDSKLTALLAIAEYSLIMTIPRYIVDAWQYCCDMTLSFENIKSERSLEAISHFVNKYYTDSEKDNFVSTHKNMFKYFN